LATSWRSRPSSAVTPSAGQPDARAPTRRCPSGVADTARDFEERTIALLARVGHRLALPLEWQDAVIRAAITLKLCTYEDRRHRRRDDDEHSRGAAAAATGTTATAGCATRSSSCARSTRSPPCGTMENYLRWLMNVVASATTATSSRSTASGSRGAALESGSSTALPGYRGMGPVRVGNQAYEHFQHDVYGRSSCSALRRPSSTGGCSGGRRGRLRALETVGEQAWLLHDQPDAGMWELRTRARVHTSSALMCWAACDRLAKIGHASGLHGRAADWRQRADQIKAASSSALVGQAAGLRRELRRHIPRRERAADGRGRLDRSPNDPRFVSTVEADSRKRWRRPFMMPLRGARRFRAPRDGLQRLRLLALDALARIGRASRRARSSRPARGAATARACCPRTSTGDRRAVGQFPADLFHGRHHQRRRAAVAPWEASYEPPGRRLQPRGRPRQGRAVRRARGAARCAEAPKAGYGSAGTARPSPGHTGRASNYSNTTASRTATHAADA
jgi:hypothetical protein